MSQITEITITTTAGDETLRLQHYRQRDVIEHWGEPDKALSGRMRQNVRGTRGVYRLEYDHNIQASRFRSIMNNILADLRGGEDAVQFTVDGDTRNVVPTEETLQRIEYAQTIAGFIPALEFYDIGRGRLQGGYVEAGYVDVGYVE